MNNTYGDFCALFWQKWVFNMYLMKMRWTYGIFGFISWQFWGNISTKDVDMAFVGYTMAYMGRFRHNCTPVKGKYARIRHVFFR